MAVVGEGLVSLSSEMLRYHMVGGLPRTTATAPEVCPTPGSLPSALSTGSHRPPHLGRIQSEKVGIAVMAMGKYDAVVVGVGCGDAGLHIGVRTVQPCGSSPYRWCPRKL